MRALANSAADATMLMNDIVSYRKEIELEGELSNGVLVVQNFLDCDLQAAVDVVNDLRTARFRQFEHVVATEFPALFDQFELGPSARLALMAYVRSLEDWSAGVVRWHELTGRYQHLTEEDAAQEAGRSGTAMALPRPVPAARHITRSTAEQRRPDDEPESPGAARVRPHAGQGERPGPAQPVRRSYGVARSVRGTLHDGRVFRRSTSKPATWR